MMPNEMVSDALYSSNTSSHRSKQVNGTLGALNEYNSDVNYETRHEIQQSGCIIQKFEFPSCCPARPHQSHTTSFKEITGVLDEQDGNQDDDMRLVHETSAATPFTGLPQPTPNEIPSPKQSSMYTSIPEATISSPLSQDYAGLADGIDALIEDINIAFLDLTARFPWVEYIDHFATQKIIFRVLVDRFQLSLRVQETLASYDENGICTNLKPVLAVRQRLRQILQPLRKVEQSDGIGQSYKRTGALLKRLRRQRRAHRSSTNLRTLQRKLILDYIDEAVLLRLSYRAVKKLEEICGDLAPLSPEDPIDLNNVTIPPELEITRQAATMIVQLVDKTCPSHSEHKLCFCLSSDKTLPETEGSGMVQFYMAFEASVEKKTLWFLVKSTQLPVDERLIYCQPEGRVSGPRPVTESTSSESNTNLNVFEPAIYFCMNNHQQHTVELAVSLKGSVTYEHQLVYPSRIELNKRQCEPETLENILDGSRSPGRSHGLTTAQKVRLAKLIAEAVLKFHPTNWLDSGCSAESVLFYPNRVPDEPQAHLRVTLVRRSNEAQGTLGLREILCRLGSLLEKIALSPVNGQATDNYYEATMKATCKSYADVVRACRKQNIGQGSDDDFNNPEMQKLYYQKVVKRLDARTFSLFGSAGS